MSVAVVRLDGPTLTLTAKLKLLQALRKAAADDSVRAVVLTGTGDVFSRGQDLKELAAALRDNPATAGDTVEAHYNPITTLLATMPKPVVAAVNGTCVGAGLGFALACDLQVWSSAATLSTAFTKIGLTCDSGLSLTLVRAVGHARASQLILLAEPFTPQQAIGWGFAGDVVPPGEVEPRALELAARLAGASAPALAASKRLLAAASLAETLRAEAREQVALGRTPEHAALVEEFFRDRS
nr:enoyl-CoA hydratase-related protein [Dactylosporangium thailandense]